MATEGTNGTSELGVSISIATSPNDIDAVPDLISKLSTGAANLATGGNEARHQLLITARTLVQALETPRETMIKHCWAQVGSVRIRMVQLSKN